MKRCCCILAAGSLLACAETAQDEVSFPLYLAGTESEAFATDSGARVQIEVADLAFGPLYLCAGRQAGELCETARLEWLDSAVVHAVEPGPVHAGFVRGGSGTVRSFMYDLGFSSLLTAEAPLMSAAAAELAGVSLRLAGRAEVGGSELRFGVELPIRLEAEAERGVPIVRKSDSDSFGHDVTIDEAGLLVRFDARPWLRGVNFEALCDGGCADTVRIEPDTQAYRSIRNAVVAGPRPVFSWGFGP